MSKSRQSYNTANMLIRHALPMALDRHGCDDLAKKLRALPRITPSNIKDAITLLWAVPRLPPDVPTLYSAMDRVRVGVSALTPASLYSRCECDTHFSTAACYIVRDIGNVARRISPYGYAEIPQQFMKAPWVDLLRRFVRARREVQLAAEALLKAGEVQHAYEFLTKKN